MSVHDARWIINRVRGDRVPPHEAARVRLSSAPVSLSSCGGGGGGGGGGDGGVSEWVSEFTLCLCHMTPVTPLWWTRAHFNPPPPPPLLLQVTVLSCCTRRKEVQVGHDSLGSILLLDVLCWLVLIIGFISRSWLPQQPGGVILCYSHAGAIWGTVGGALDNKSKNQQPHLKLQCAEFSDI